MAVLRCHYCGWLLAFGLDRTSAAGSYNALNVVPSCGLCNRMKGTATDVGFERQIRRILSHHGLLQARLPVRCNVFTSYAMHAMVDNITPPLLHTGDQRGSAHQSAMQQLHRALLDTLWAQLCYLCGCRPSFGVDAVDASQHYCATNNAMPFCMECNRTLELIHGLPMK